MPKINKILLGSTAVAVVGCFVVFGQLRHARSERELAQAGPRPALFFDHGVVGMLPP